MKLVRLLHLRLEEERKRHGSYSNPVRSPCSLLTKIYANGYVGTYAYQFCFLLPSTLPPTLHVPHGSVSYTLRATVYRHTTSLILPSLLPSLHSSAPHPPHANIQHVHSDSPNSPLNPIPTPALAPTSTPTASHSIPGTLTATQEVSLVSFPRADLEEEGEEDPGCALQGDWRDRLTVRAHVSPGKVPIGGEVLLTLDITPGVPMKIWGISVVLDGELIFTPLRFGEELMGEQRR